MEVSKEDIFKTKRRPKGPISFKLTLNEEQKEAKRIILNNPITVLLGSAGSGKTLTATNVALDQLFNREVDKIVITRPTVTEEDLGFLPGPQPLDSKVLTPYGWSTIKDINVGDKVINSKGIYSTVINKSKIRIEPVYEITTADGRKTRAAANHLFYTRTLNDRKHVMDKKYGHKYKGSVKTVHEILNTLCTNKGKLNHSLPKNKAVLFESIKEHIIPPYVLGCLIGDGSFSKHNITLHNIDLELIERCKILLEPLGLKFHNTPNTISYCISANPVNNKPSKTVVIKDLKTGVVEKFHQKYKALDKYPMDPGTLNTRCLANSIIEDLEFSFEEKTEYSTNLLKNELINLGLFGKTSVDKFIPKEYIYNSTIEDRLELLRGLLDTDGTCDKNLAAFTTVSKQLAHDIIELVQSLGGKANYYIRDRRDRESLLKGRKIKSNFISYEVTINVPENPFYISRKSKKYKVKTNSNVLIESIKIVTEEPVQCLLLDSEDGLYITDDYIVTHNSINEKMDPWLQPIYQNFYALYGKEKIEKEISEGNIEILPMSYIRGITFVNTFVIADEVQNLTHTQMEALLGRLGQNSRMVLCGDTSQIDLRNKKNSGLGFLRRVEEQVEGFRIITLKQNHRHSIVQPILDVYKIYAD
jgi:phosphate starvation-inducible protein PhoH